MFTDQDRIGWAMTADSFVSILHVAKLITLDRQCLCLIRSLSPNMAIIRAGIPLNCDDYVTLSLRSGYDISACVSEVQGERIVLAFEVPISIGTILAEQRQGHDGLESVRFAIAAPILVHVQDGIYPCVMQDIALSGTDLKDDAHVLDVGMTAQIHIKGLGRREARVVGRQGSLCRLRFRHGLGYEMLDRWIRQASGPEPIERRIPYAGRDPSRTGRPPEA